MGPFSDWDIYFYSIIFIAIATRNVYEGNTNSDRNLSADTTAINYNRNVILLHTLSLHPPVFPFLFSIPMFTALLSLNGRMTFKSMTILEQIECLSSPYLGSNTIQ